MKEKAPIVDVDKIRRECLEYTDKEIGNAEREFDRKLKEGIDDVRHKHEMLGAEFENFKQRDFRELEGRVTALEKKF